MIGWTIFALTALGCILCLVVLVVHRPTRFFSLTAMNAVGWELIALALLARATAQLLITGSAWHYHSGTASVLFGVVTLVLIDARIAYKLWTLMIFQAAFNAERKAHAESDAK